MDWWSAYQASLVGSAGVLVLEIHSFTICSNKSDTRIRPVARALLELIELFAENLAHLLLVLASDVARQWDNEALRVRMELPMKCQLS